MMKEKITGLCFKDKVFSMLKTKFIFHPHWQFSFFTEINVSFAKFLGLRNVCRIMDESSYFTIEALVGTLISIRQQ